MRPTDACTIITSTFGVASRSSVPVIGASSSRRVRGSNRTLVVCRALASLRESEVTHRAPSLYPPDPRGLDDSAGITPPRMRLLDGGAGHRAAARAVSAAVPARSTRVYRESNGGGSCLSPHNHRGSASPRHPPASPPQGP